MSKYMVAALAFAIFMLPVGGAPSRRPTLWLNRDERRKALRTTFFHGFTREHSRVLTCAPFRF